MHHINATNPPPQLDRLLRLPEVESCVGLKRSAIYALIAAGEFPRGLQLTARCVVWKSSVIAQWIEARCEQANNRQQSPKLRAL